MNNEVALTVTGDRDSARGVAQRAMTGEVVLVRERWPSG
jgi:hypothetical protein